MKYIIKPIGSDLRDYAVINTHTYEVVCKCYIKKNAELIADILNTDDNVYVYKIVKAESEDEE